MCTCNVYALRMSFQSVHSEIKISGGISELHKFKHNCKYISTFLIYMYG
jgi:hypothetical protein